MHPLFIGFSAPVIFLGFRTLISLGLRTHFYFLGFTHPYFFGFTHPSISLGLCTHYLLGFTHPLFSLGLRTHYLSGFTHPLFSLGLRTLIPWVYAPVILWAYAPAFFLGTMHPFISLGLRTHYFFVFYTSITFLLDFYTPTDLFKITHQPFFAWSTLSPHPLGFDMVYMLTILRLVFEPTIFVGCLCILVGCNIYLQSST
jgi:hypothetical protein